MVNVLPPSHVFGERGLLRMGPRNATVAQTSSGAGRIFQFSGLDYQAIKAGKDPLSVQAKVRLTTNMMIQHQAWVCVLAPLPLFAPHFASQCACLIL
jgi:hypothetical protein